MADTGCDISIIKINCLKGELIVDETQKLILKGINDQLVETVGKITIPIQINNKTFQVDFNVVYPNFPTLQDGILGYQFLKKNGGSINAYNDTLVLDNEITNNEINVENEILLKPRTETVIELPIADPSVENKNIIIYKQEVIENVYSSNVIGKVKNGKIVVTILNITEEDKNININDLNKIKYDNEEDYELLKINNNNEKYNSNKINRINKIKSLIRSDHMNKEEKQSIIEICEQYSDIFHLEGDHLTFTNAAEHNIKINENQTPIYKRPYRLPYSQQDEINSQIRKMLDDDIIEQSTSPWNAPLGTIS